MHGGLLHCVWCTPEFSSAFEKKGISKVSGTILASFKGDRAPAVPT
jgi:hypothetical protein